MGFDDLVLWIGTTGGFVGWGLGVFEFRNKWPKVRLRVLSQPNVPRYDRMTITVQNVRLEPTSMEPIIRHDLYPLPERRFSWPRGLRNEWQIPTDRTGELPPHQERTLELFLVAGAISHAPWVLARVKVRLTRGRSATEWEHLVLGRIGRLRFWWHWLRLCFNSAHMRGGVRTESDYKVKQARKR